MMVCGGQCAAAASGGDKKLKWCADNLVTLALVHNMLYYYVYRK